MYNKINLQHKFIFSKKIDLLLTLHRPKRGIAEYAFQLCNCALPMVSANVNQGVNISWRMRC